MQALLVLLTCMLAMTLPVSVSTTQCPAVSTCCLPMRVPLHWTMELQAGEQRP